MSAEAGVRRKPSAWSKNRRLDADVHAEPQLVTDDAS